MSGRPPMTVLVGPGTNCERETVEALNHFGANASVMYIADLKSGEANLVGTRGIVIPGGFGYGDIIRAGALFALDLRTPRVAEQMNEHAQKYPVMGTCNGYQALMESGLITYGRIDPEDEIVITLDGNRNIEFEARTIKMRMEDSICPFIPDEYTGMVIDMAAAHAEGRHVATSPEAYENLLTAGRVVFRYCDALGEPTEEYPANPNGSPHGIAATCSPNGLVFGMMPHDERFARTEHHPNWRREDVIVPDNSDGIDFRALVLRGVINYAKEM